MSVEELCEQNQNYRYEIVEAREKILALEQKIKDYYGYDCNHYASSNRS